MIFVRDKGRMCNNMLQYAHAYAWAREHNRNILSMRFAYKYQYFRLCHQIKHNFFSYLIGKYGATWHIINTISFLYPEDEGSNEIEQRMLSTKNFMLEGWFVRYYDLFLKYKDEIVDMFAFDGKIVNKVNSYLEEKSKQADLRLGVHIRRGDYKTFKDGKYFYSDDVYIDYIKHFMAVHSNEQISVFICGNDPHLDHDKYFSALSQCTINFPNGNPAEDLCLLSKCDYIIGPPSTFSLVASMYYDIPLLWMQSADGNTVNHKDSWGKFNKLFKEII